MLCIVSPCKHMVLFPGLCICNCWFHLSCVALRVSSRHTSCQTETHLKSNRAVTQKTKNAHFVEILLMYELCRSIEQIREFIYAIKFGLSKLMSLNADPVFMGAKYHTHTIQFFFIVCLLFIVCQLWQRSPDFVTKEKLTPSRTP